MRLTVNGSFVQKRIFKVANERQSLLASRGFLAGRGGAALAYLGAGAEGQLTASPLLADGITTGQEASVHGANEVLEGTLILSVHLSEGSDSAGLLADGITKTSLVLHDGVRDLLGAAQGGNPENELNGVDVVGNDNKLGLLLLDGAGDLLKARHDGEWGLGGDSLLGVGLLLGGNLGEASAALLAGLGGVLLDKLEELVAARAVENLAELVDGRGDLQAALEDTLLALHGHERGPAHEARQVARVRHILANTEVLGASLEGGWLSSGLLGGGLSGLLVGSRGLGGGLRGLLDFLAGHFLVP